MSRYQSHIDALKENGSVQDEEARYLATTRKKRAKMARIQSILKKCGPNFVQGMVQNILKKETGKIGTDD